MKILISLVSENYDHPPVLMGKLFAEAIPSEVDVLIIVPEKGHWENAEAMKEQVRSDFSDLKVDIFIRQGKSSQVYQEFLEKREYNLIIVDPQRDTGFGGKANINAVIKKAKGLAILLSEYPKPKLENILLATACKEGDHDLITAGARLAEAFHAQMTLLHVISGNVPAMYTGLKQLDETVEELLQTDTVFAQHLRKGIEILNKHKVDSRVKIRRGVPLEEIVRETQMENYDLAVVGSSEAKEDIRGRLMGNLTSRIIDEVKLPVLIVDDRLFDTWED